MKIAVGSDHGGIHLKNHIREYLTAKGIEVLDCGTYTEESTDYPDYAAKVCQAINTGEAERGILVLVLVFLLLLIKFTVSERLCAAMYFLPK